MSYPAMNQFTKSPKGASQSSLFSDDKFIKDIVGTGKVLKFVMLVVFWPC